MSSKRQGNNASPLLLVLLSIVIGGLLFVFAQSEWLRELDYLFWGMGISWAVWLLAFGLSKTVETPSKTWTALSIVLGVLFLFWDFSPRWETKAWALGMVLIGLGVLSILYHQSSKLEEWLYSGSQESLIGGTPVIDFADAAARVEGITSVAYALLDVEAERIDAGAELLEKFPPALASHPGFKNVLEQLCQCKDAVQRNKLFGKLKNILDAKWAQNSIAHQKAISSLESEWGVSGQNNRFPTLEELEETSFLPFRLMLDDDFEGLVRKLGDCRDLAAFCKACEALRKKLSELKPPLPGHDQLDTNIEEALVSAWPSQLKHYTDKLSDEDVEEIFQQNDTESENSKIVDSIQKMEQDWKAHELAKSLKSLNAFAKASCYHARRSRQFQVRRYVVERLRARESFHRHCAGFSVLGGLICVLLALAFVFHLERPSNTVQGDIVGLLAPVSEQQRTFDNTAVRVSYSSNEGKGSEWNLRQIEEDDDGKFLLREKQGRKYRDLKAAAEDIVKFGVKPIKILVTSSSGASGELSESKKDLSKYQIEVDSDGKLSPKDKKTRLETLAPSDKHDLELVIGDPTASLDSNHLNLQIILTPLSRIGATIIAVFGVYFCVQLSIYHSRLVTFYYGRAEAILLAGQGMFGQVPSDRWELGEIAALLSAHDIEQGEMPEFQAVASSITGLDPQKTLRQESKK